MPPSLCTGPNPVSSYEEYLTAFRKGPCPPILFHHGFLGVSLHLSVDCSKLKAAKKNNEAKMVLDKCSFMCRFWKSNKYENVLWLTHQPMWKYFFWSDFNFFWKNRECAYYLMEVHKRLKKTTKWNMDLNRIQREEKYENLEIPGVTISPYGQTESTKEDGQCGLTAVEKIIGDQSPYKTINTVFRSFGYVNGITFQHNTYDFRVNAYESHVIDQGKLALNMLNAFTGKRSLVFGHSYGNNVAMLLLKNMLQSEKDRLVREYVAVGPPFLGALEALFTVLGNAGFMYLPSIQQKFGIEWLSKYFDGLNPKYARQVFPTFDGMYEFLTIHSQVETIYNQIKSQKDEIQKAGIPEILFNDLLDDLKLASSSPVVKKNYKQSKNPEYKLEELSSMLGDLGLSPFFKKYFDRFDYEAVSCYSNPGVATRVMFFSELPTSSFMTLHEDPVKALDNYRFPKADFGKSRGDQTVNLFSLAGPPMAWFSEYINHKNKLENLKKLDDGETSSNDMIPKKITFVEFGFRKNVKNSDSYKYIQCKDPLDPKVSEDEYNMSQNDFRNLPWFNWIYNKGINLFSMFKDFIKKPWNQNGKFFETHFGYTAEPEENHPLCNHSMMVQTEGFFRHIAEVILTPDGVEAKDVMIDAGLPDQAFEQFVIDCPALRCRREFDECWVIFKQKFGFE